MAFGTTLSETLRKYKCVVKESKLVYGERVHTFPPFPRPDIDR